MRQQSLLRTTLVLWRRWPVAAMTLLVACGSSSPQQPHPGPPADQVRDPVASIPTTEPSIRGTVTLVQPGDSLARTGGAGDPNAAVSCPPDCAPRGPRLRAVLIEERPGGLHTGGAKSHVTVLAGTPVLRRTGGVVTEVGFAALRVGQKVSAWFDGPVAESYPARATAGAILIEE